MSGRYEQDFLDRARSVAASVLFAAGLAAIVGSLLDWVTIDPPSRLPSEESADPYTGIEARDGWWVILGAIVVMGSAALLVIRQRALFGWTSFLVWIAIGAIAIADYRGVDDLSSDISRRMNRAGDIDPGLGLTLVAASALVGVIASVAGVAASPRPD
jgi:LPXTG-motif cell wall-anchored protein